jgi:hypothetical protein
MHDCAEFRCWAYGQATLILSGDVALEDTSSFDLLAPSGGEMLFRISLR